MENTLSRRLVIAVGFVLFFAVIVLVWYFFYAKPIIAPSLSETNNPLPERTFPVGFQFLNWGGEDVGTSSTEVIDPLKLPLVQVWNKPAAGQTFVSQNILKEVVSTTTQGTTTIEVRKTVRASSTALLFVDKVTGYIYAYPLETGIIYQISNTIIPGVHDAYFLNNGTQVVIRYIDREKNTVSALVAKVPNVTKETEALPLEEISYLSSTVTSIATNARKDRVSYVVGTDNGSSIYTLSPKGPTLITSSPFKEWDLSYGGETLFVTTKPSAYVEGVTARVPGFNLVTVNKTGLASNPNNGGDLLNSMWTSSGLATFITTKNGDFILPIKTLASKCVWGEKDFLVCAVPRILPRGQEGLPDDWFQGRVSFNDDIFVVDKNTGSQFPLYVFNDKEGIFDITNITLLKTNDILSFTKKQDETLWLINTNLIEGQQ